MVFCPEMEPLRAGYFDAWLAYHGIQGWWDMFKAMSSGRWVLVQTVKALLGLAPEELHARDTCSAACPTSISPLCRRKGNREGKPTKRRNETLWR